MNFKKIVSFVCIALLLPSLLACTSSAEEQIMGYWKSIPKIGGFAFTDHSFIHLTKDTYFKMTEKGKKLEGNTVTYEVTDKGILMKSNAEKTLGFPLQAYKVIDENHITAIMYRNEPLKYERITEEAFNAELARRQEREKNKKKYVPKNDPF